MIACGGISADSRPKAGYDHEVHIEGDHSKDGHEGGRPRAQYDERCPEVEKRVDNTKCIDIWAERRIAYRPQDEVKKRPEYNAPAKSCRNGMASAPETPDDVNVFSFWRPFDPLSDEEGPLRLISDNPDPPHDGKEHTDRQHQDSCDPVLILGELGPSVREVLCFLHGSEAPLFSAVDW